MAKKKEKRGGYREGAGRPKAKDKATPITFYLAGSTVKKVGGKPKARKIAIEAVENAAAKNNKK